MKYVLVSQGIKIAEYDSKEEAETIMQRENEEFYKYAQECIDNYEMYADNEVFLYEMTDEEYENHKRENE